MKTIIKYLFIIFIIILPFMVIGCSTTATCIGIVDIVKISPDLYKINTAIIPSCPEKIVFKKLNEETKDIMDDNGYKSYFIVERNLRWCKIQFFKDTIEKEHFVKILKEKKNKFIELSQKYLIGITPYEQFKDDINTLGGTEHQIESRSGKNNSKILEVVEFGGLFILYVRIFNGLLAEIKLVDEPLEFPE